MCHGMDCQVIPADVLETINCGTLHCFHIFNYCCLKVLGLLSVLFVNKNALPASSLPNFFEAVFLNLYHGYNNTLLQSGLIVRIT